MTTQRRSGTPDSRRRSETSRRAILTAAFDLVGEVGYAKLSIEGIAARAGVGKQTIYRWWPSKGALLFDAFLTLAEPPDGGPTALPDTGDLEADLKLVLRATVEELRDPRYDGPMRALHTEIVNDPALAAEYAERLGGPMRELKKERLRAARHAGQLAEDVDLDLAVDMIFGPVLDRWLHRTGPLTAAFADRVVETALRGLSPRR
ncbi:MULTISPECIES: TetR/AcrR family transcriptional regulator [Streptomycetaceae]|uniref:Regulatory protein, TetR n=1 Tax=Streptantibioticus cattleyicolor (strain ATCC 35852 / DSM 46488 / JCM 4925 / NBRC 14057 / NRRL 8057) TaxID=1003195 RepID=F8K1X5_STREN|nr:MULTISPECIES: TetR/AcrR family transcriptional regulator [Streptomycetaceae]AEW92452.1 regulatory protein, TetR [Streptantibioticus cattleyicolor NRRL 8057 = DSM 46488]MYS57259.1 TetR family transcriptional regulator [Streptomyces sp. SID5468]CCB72816.1 Regulatory protein, TetR [Streptantibioticus cattleyicolor NRRL 8057 = DSM 46488]